MVKKFGLLLAAVALGLLAVPVIATASTGLTSPAGTLVPVGSIVTFTNVGNVTITDPKTGNTTCSHVSYAAKVKSNSAAGVAFEEETAAVTSGCQDGGFLAHVSGFLTKVVSGAAMVGRVITAIKMKDELSSLTCTFSMSEGEGTYTSGGSTMSFKEVALTASPAACGTATFDGTFETKTASGASIIVM